MSSTMQSSLSIDHRFNRNPPVLNRAFSQHVARTITPSCSPPQYYPCFKCLQLHLWRNVPLPNGKQIVHVCPRCMYQGSRVGYEPDSLHERLQILDLERFPHYTYYKLDFAHVQLVMRRFLYGPAYGILVESLRFTEVSSTRIHPVERTTELRPCKSHLPWTWASGDEGKHFKGSLAQLSEEGELDCIQRSFPLKAASALHLQAFVCECSRWWW